MPVTNPRFEVNERARLRELEKENRDLRMEVESLRKGGLLRAEATVTDKHAVITRGEGRLPDREQVRVAGGVPGRLLPVAESADLGHRPPAQHAQVIETFEGRGGPAAPAGSRPSCAPVARRPAGGWSPTGTRPGGLPAPPVQAHDLRRPRRGGTSQTVVYETHRSIRFTIGWGYLGTS